MIKCSTHLHENTQQELNDESLIISPPQHCVDFIINYSKSLMMVESESSKKMVMIAN